MTSDPEQLRQQIEQTQRGLSADVNALTEKVTPSRIVHRRVDRARRTLTSMKDTIMGTASDTTDRMGSTASTVADSVTSAASSAGQVIGEAPSAIRRQTRGNPLAAGLIAFGFGWLTASLLPPSKREQEIADQAKGLAQEHVQPAIGEVAEELKDSLREPAEHAVESVKSTAQDAKSRAQDTIGSGREQANGQEEHRADHL